MLSLQTFLSGFVMLAALCSVKSYSQNAKKTWSEWDNQIQVNAGPMFMTGDKYDIYKTGVSLQAMYYARVSEHLFIGLGTGYISMPVDEIKAASVINPGVPPNQNITIVWNERAIPLSIGVRYITTTVGFQPYIGLDLAVLFRSVEYSASHQGNTVSGKDDDRGGAIVPKAGFRMSIGKNVDFDMNLAYVRLFEASDWNGFAALNIGMAFAL